ncbi:MAG: hypothetical protein ACFHVJ_17925 [Aestuariibacter sp.]
MSHRETIAQFVGQILHGSLEGQVSGLNALKDLLIGLTGLDSIHDTRSFAKTGLILSPEDAASCMLSPGRTVKYWLACIEQIQEKAQQGSDCIHILYPGTGPFGTLLIPLLCYFQWQDLKITLVEYNKGSAQCLSRLIEVLQLPFNINLHNQDAIKFVPEQPIDILLMECMLAALQQEGQVPLTLHFATHLSEDGVIIPQKVEIALQYIDSRKELELIEKKKNNGFQGRAEMDFTRQLVSQLFLLDKNTVHAYRKSNNALSLGKVGIPAPSKELPDLVLTTRIILNNRHTLKQYEDGLTFPMLLSDWQVSAGFVTEVRYELFEQPRFTFNEGL